MDGILSIKTVRRLSRDKKYRDEKRLVVVEGTRMIEEVLSAQLSFVSLFVTKSWLEEHFSVVKLALVPHLVVSEDEMQSLSATKTPAGIVGVIQQPELDWPQSMSLVLVLDGLRDPGNVGTLLRSAAAAGVSGVILTPGCVDVFNSKVVRASMGAFLRVPVKHFSWDEIRKAYAGMPIFAADAAGSTEYTAVDWKVPSLLIVGNEPHGLSEQARELATALLSIPMEQGSESLNAAVAASVILFEARRQRALI